MDTDKICGLVILYHPSQKEIENIRLFLGKLKKFWIIDNSEYDLRDYNGYFTGAGNAVIVQDGRNLGIGARINDVIEKASDEGFEWVLTMDQDSTFTSAGLTSYLHKIGTIDSDNDIAMIGVNYAGQDAKERKEPVLKPATNMITSGTAVNIKVARKIGMFKKELFIDEVDTEFSYRALVNGWKIMICEGIQMEHTLGERKMGRSLMSFKVSSRSIYTPLRLYYITRNFLWVRQHYRKYFPEIFKERSRQLLTVYKNNILYNSRRWEAINMIWKGYKDYKRGLLGKFSF